MPLPEFTPEQRAWYILQGYDIKVDRYGNRSWYKNSKLHREDGPALEYTNGTKYWYLNGLRMSKKKYQIAIQILREEQNAT